MVPKMLKAARMARAAMRLSTAVFVASLLTGVATFLTWMYLAAISLAMVNDCCSPGPAVPRPLVWTIRSMEIASSIAVALAVAALIQWRLERRPPDCRKRVTWALVFGLLSSAIVITADMFMR
jgi:hypothetical protein